MDKRFFAWIGAGFIAIGLLAVAVQIIRIAANIVQANSNGGDLATWIGAIGTVGTLGGTVWIAQRETSLKRKEARELAQLTACALKVRASEAGIALTNCYNEILFALEKGKLNVKVFDVLLKMRLSTLNLWNVEEVRALIVLPNNCAARLMLAGTQIENLIKHFEAVSGGEMSREQVEVEFRQTMQFIDEILPELTLAVDECQREMRDVVPKRDLKK